MMCGTLLFVCGCATVPVTSTDILWPAPPATPRIKFLATLRNQDDLRQAVAGPGASGGVMSLLLGAKEPSTSLRQPMDVAVSADGQRVYVSDFAKPGVVVFDFGTQQVRPFGATGDSFKAPFGLALDDQENLYVADSMQRTISVFAPSGALLRTLALELDRPTDIAIDRERLRLYVADAVAPSSPIRTVKIFDLEGRSLGQLDPPDQPQRVFASPTYLAVGADGTVYVTDTLKAQVHVFGPDGRYLRSVGERGDAYGMFDKPKGVALDSLGNLYVVDSAWSNVQIFNRAGAVLLFFGGRGSEAGWLFNPTGIAIGRDDRIFVADAFNARISVYQLINTTADEQGGGGA